MHARFPGDLSAPPLHALPILHSEELAVLLSPERPTILPLRLHGPRRRGVSPTHEADLVR